MSEVSTEVVAEPTEMEKIMAVLKEEGLELAEETAMATLKSVVRALPKIAMATSNKVDDLLVPVLIPLVKPLEDLIDKINGKKDV